MDRVRIATRLSRAESRDLSLDTANDMAGKENVMKRPKAWFDRRYSHKHVIPRSGWSLWFFFLLFLAFTASSVIGLFRVWGDAFLGGTAAPITVLRAFGLTLLTGLIISATGGVSFLLFSRELWPKHIRGYVLWILTGSSGREWRVVTPRGQRPRLKTANLFALGVPLGGWWHSGQSWNGADRLTLDVRQKSEWMGKKIQIRDPFYHDLVSTSYEDTTAVLRLLRENPSGAWRDILYQAQLKIEGLRTDNERLQSRIRGDRDRILGLETQLSDWRDAADELFNSLMGTSRLVYSSEGQEIARRWRDQLLKLMPENMSTYLKYREAQIPPTRRRLKTTREDPPHRSSDHGKTPTNVG